MTDIAATLGSTMQTLLGFCTPPVVAQTPELQATEESTRGRGGRPRGSGHQDRDIPLVVELDRRVRTGEAATRTEAARQLADQAYGPNTQSESKAWRLRRLHKEYFSAPR